MLDRQRKAIRNWGSSLDTFVLLLWWTLFIEDDLLNRERMYTTKHATRNVSSAWLSVIFFCQPQSIYMTVMHHIAFFIVLYGLWLLRVIQRCFAHCNFTLLFFLIVHVHVLQFGRGHWAAVMLLLYRGHLIMIDIFLCCKLLYFFFRAQFLNTLWQYSVSQMLLLPFSFFLDLRVVLMWPAACFVFNNSLHCWYLWHFLCIHAFACHRGCILWHVLCCTEVLPCFCNPS